MNMRIILVPTDFSPEADRAVKIASAIAHQTGAAIQLLHVIQSVYMYEYTEGPASLPDNAQHRLAYQIGKAEEKVLALAQEIQSQGIKVEYDVQVGSTARHISGIIAGNDQVELIVMGTKGDAGLQGLVTGLNAETLVQQAACPVLSVYGTAGDFRLRTVVLATDFSDNTAPLLSRIKEWQEVFGFCLHIVYINTPLMYNTTSRIEDRLPQFVQKYNLQACQTVIMDEYSHQEVIRQYAERVQADMIAVIRHGRSGMAYLLDGSMGGEVVNPALTPVLTYNRSANHL